MKRLVCMVTILSIILTFNVSASGLVKNSSLADGVPSSWAAESTQKVIDAKIFEDSFSSYTSDISRIEFAKMMVKMYELITDKTVIADRSTTFKDCVETTTPSQYDDAYKAKALGVTLGYEDGSFKPLANITREELSVMFTRALKKADIQMPTTKGQLFTDHNKMALWSQQAIYDIKNLGIVKGIGDNLFEPKGKTTVEQAIVMMVRSLDKYNEGWVEGKKVIVPVPVATPSEIATLKAPFEAPITSSGRKASEIVEIYELAMNAVKDGKSVTVGYDEVANIANVNFLSVGKEINLKIYLNDFSKKSNYPIQFFFGDTDSLTYYTDFKAVHGMLFTDIVSIILGVNTANKDWQFYSPIELYVNKTTGLDEFYLKSELPVNHRNIFTRVKDGNVLYTFSDSVF